MFLTYIRGSLIASSSNRALDIRWVRSDIIGTKLGVSAASPQWFEGVFHRQNTLLTWIRCPSHKKFHGHNPRLSWLMHAVIRSIEASGYRLRVITPGVGLLQIWFGRSNAYCGLIPMRSWGLTFLLSWCLPVPPFLVLRIPIFIGAFYLANNWREFY